MARNITNCVRCNKVFRKTVSDKCPACAAREQDQFSNLYQILQDARLTGGIHATQLAEKVGMSEDVIEEIFLEGKMGTSSHFIQFTCRNCKNDFSGKEGHSRICIRCRSQVSVEAGVGIHSIQDVERRAEDTKRQQQSQMRLKAQGSSVASANALSENSPQKTGEKQPEPVASTEGSEEKAKPTLSLKKQEQTTSNAPPAPTQRSAGLKRLD